MVSIQFVKPKVPHGVKNALPLSNKKTSGRSHGLNHQSNLPRFGEKIAVQPCIVV